MVDPQHPVVEEHHLPLKPHLRGLSGLRIVHLSDIHAGPSMRQRRLDRMVAQVNALEPDFIAITGDIMNWQRRYLADVIESFRHLRARLGTFAILGNHDFYFGAKRLIQGLHEATPVRFIGKQRLRFEEAEGLSFTGVNDPMVAMTAEHDYPELEALSAENDPDHFHVLLTHRPDAFEAAQRSGYDLVLCGHTHGGQVSFTDRLGRAFNIARLATRYDQGLFIEGRTHLYVSRGIGYTGVPFRIGCPPEIGLFKLSHDAASAHKKTPRPAAPNGESVPRIFS